MRMTQCGPCGVSLSSCYYRSRYPTPCLIPSPVPYHYPSLYPSPFPSPYPYPYPYPYPICRPSAKVSPHPARVPVSHNKHHV